MKRYGNLFKLLISWENLLLAARKAFKGKKAKYNAAFYYFYLEPELLRLQEELRNNTYEMRAYRSFIIHEPKMRKICAADFRDRIIHHAICNILEPIFEKSFIYDTYACRKAKGSHAAVKRAQYFMRKSLFYLKCDISKYYESIDHSILKSLLLKKLKDKRFLYVLYKIIDHPMPETISGKGLPIGNLTSQLFANLYLGVLDHFIKECLHIKHYIRYMDDFVLFCNDKKILHKCLNEIEDFLLDKLNLKLKQSQTYISPSSEGLPFLGFRIYPALIRMQRKKWINFCRKLIDREKAFESGEMEEIFFIQSIASLISHTKHANTLNARRKFFERRQYF